MNISSINYYSLEDESTDQLLESSPSLTTVADELATVEFFICSGCQGKFTQLFQFDLCRKCLQKRFNKLIPVINKVRSR